jgi:hypothetical protein
MKFHMFIELGNAAMSSNEDIADALREVADRVESSGDSAPPRVGASIRDDNGNTVGQWTFEP